MDVYVARQPILDRLCRTYGYELLFRDGSVNAFLGGDPELATATEVETTCRLTEAGAAAVMAAALAEARAVGVPR